MTPTLRDAAAAARSRHLIDPGHGEPHHNPVAHLIMHPHLAPVAAWAMRRDDPAAHVGLPDPPSHIGTDDPPATLHIVLPGPLHHPTGTGASVKTLTAR